MRTRCTCGRFRLESAQLCGHMAAEWLTWESEHTGRPIRQQINGRDKRIDKLMFDVWCSETNTVYQLHGCFFPWSPMHPTRGSHRQRVTQGLNARRDPTEHRLPTSLCQGRRGMRMKGDEERSGRKNCLDAAFPRRRHARWTMTSQQILSDVRAGIVFGMIECDICVPDELREHFEEMQPVIKNICLKLDDLGPFMRRYSEEKNNMTPRRMLVACYRGNKILLATPLLLLVYGPRASGDARLPGQRVRCDSVFPAVRTP